MRINRDTLLGIAGDTVAQRVRQDRGVLSAYLCGSLLGDNYLLGGTADIDLVFIHIDTPPVEREIVRLTDEVHLDIAHYAQKVFREPRRLRQHAWLGPTIFSCRLLSDSQHFMDFTQASVRGQFEQPDHVLERARPQLDHARQIWEGLSSKATGQAGPQEVSLYLKAIEHAVNAVACLSGPPLTERRFLLGFPERAAAARHPGLYPGLLGMLGAPRVSPEAIRPMLSQWEEMLRSAARGGAAGAPASGAPLLLPAGFPIFAGERAAADRFMALVAHLDNGCYAFTPGAFLDGRLESRLPGAGLAGRAFYRARRGIRRISGYGG